HPALADGREQPVRAENLALQRRRRGRAIADTKRVFQEMGLLHVFMFGEQVLEVGAERGVARGNRREPCRAFLSANLECPIEVRTERAPAITRYWRHGGP